MKNLRDSKIFVCLFVCIFVKADQNILFFCTVNFFELTHPILLILRIINQSSSLPQNNDPILGNKSCDCYEENLPNESKCVFWVPILITNLLAVIFFTVTDTYRVGIRDTEQPLDN